MNTKSSKILITTAAAVALSGLIGTGLPAAAVGPVSSNRYTTLNHPALPCHLSKADVANWGETSAHLPLACTYYK
ncbi:MAG: hypothetical protein WAV00_21865 [Nocardioides sp.]